MSIQQTVQVIQALVQSVLWPVLVALLPWLFLKAIKNLPIVKQILISGIVKHAVQMVAQKFGNLTPEEKRKEAELAIYSLAKFFGYNIDPVVVNTILESIVWETKQAVGQVALSIPVTPQSTEIKPV